ncbi:MAG: hypothetical protein M3N38_05260 [Pseudomonadota bacterium]|nr:hypothetical protein [Pseudomonadota bacterium]
MDFTFVFAPHIPAAIAYSLIALAAVPVAVAIFARSRGAVLRSLALLCLALALLNPIIREEDREALSDIAVLVIDRSLSQEVSGRTAVTAEAARKITEVIQSLPATELRTAVVTSGNGNDDDGTRAFAALTGALSDVPPERYAGALMLSDGQVHDAPASLRGEGYNGPLHALLSGDRNEKDRRLIVEKSPRFGIVGQSHTIELRVEDQGANSAAASYRVTVVHDDDRTSTIEARPGEHLSVDIEIKHGGRNYTEVAVEALPGEIALQNNRTVVVTDGIRDRLQVLLVSGEPHPGERTWRNLLKADASVDLVHFTILRPPEKQDGTPVKELSLIAFPTRELFVEKLSEFDLIIFDRYQRRGILPTAYLTNVVDYVENGGAVLIASGPDYASPLSLYDTPLSAVLPAAPSGSVTAEPFRPVVTEPGKRHPVTRGLPGSEADPPAWGRWFRLADVLAKTAGDVVMAGPDDKPLLLLSRQGKGRAALLLSDQAWLWARGFEGGGPQTELLRRLAHWLMKEPELEEEALLGRQSGRNLIVERRTMAEQADAVTVTKPSGDSAVVPLAEVSPGIWRGTLTSSENGIHRLSDGKLTAASALGEAGTRELEELIATDRKLAPLVSETRGGAYWLGRNPQAPALPRIVKQREGRALAGSGWLGLKANGAYRVRSISELPLFGTLIGLALLLGFASLTWFREGR